MSGLRSLIREMLAEVDTDPSNNPGRPEDPYDYLGMHPPANAAMAHPGAGGGSTTSLAGSPDGTDLAAEPDAEGTL